MNDVFMTEIKRKEREQDLREAYMIDLRRQRKYEKRREVEEKECCRDYIYIYIYKVLCKFSQK